MTQEDDDLVSYWRDLPRPPPVPPEPVIPGYLWMGLSNGAIELSTEWYQRLPIAINENSDGDRLVFRSTFEKPFPSPGVVTRIGLWSSKSRGELLYWKDIETVNIESVESLTYTLEIHDNPLTQPIGFRRLLKHIGLL